jgi:sulfur-oxidizing protein SoxY
MRSAALYSSRSGWRKPSAQRVIEIGDAVMHRRFSLAGRLCHTSAVCRYAALIGRWISPCIAMACFFSGSVYAIGDEQQPSSSAWDALRARYYGDQSMGFVDEGFMSLEVPGNTSDPSATPLTLRFSDDAQRRIKRVRVFIDNNPSPLVATFDFGSATPVTEINLRVRVDRFTSVRAVAETVDGGLEMRSSWVKASGGCSAPPSAAAGGVLGEIRLRPSADSKSILVSIRHPNNSGFQIDPQSGNPILAHYISHLRLSAGGKVLLDAETGISLSENPTLRIASDRSLPLPISIDAVDSETQAHFIASWQGAAITEHAALH